MQNCKIAVLDSGCSPTQMRNLNIIHTRNFLDRNDSCVDDHGHGTAILYTINQMFSGADFIILKVLDHRASSKVSVILEALEYLKQIEADYVCMSFATSLEGEKRRITQLCGELKKQGKVLIAAKANSGAVSYPAELENVLGIEGVLMKDARDFWYQPDYSIQVAADLTPIMVPDKNYEKGYMFGGNSKAAALLCGQLAGSGEETETFLRKKRKRKEWDNQEIIEGKVYKYKIKEEQSIEDKLYYDFMLILKKYIGKIDQKSDLHLYLSPNDYYDILSEIQHGHNINFDCFEIQYKDFDTVLSLYQKLIQY